MKKVIQNKHNYLEHRKIKIPPHKYLAAKTKNKDRQSHIIWLHLLQDPGVFIVINFCLGREKKSDDQCHVTVYFYTPLLIVNYT